MELLPEAETTSIAPPPGGAEIEISGSVLDQDRGHFRKLWRRYYPADHRQHPTDKQCFRLFTEQLDAGYSPDEIIGGVTDDRPPLLFDFLRGKCWEAVA